MVICLSGDFNSNRYSFCFGINDCRLFPYIEMGLHYTSLCACLISIDKDNNFSYKISAFSVYLIFFDESNEGGAFNLNRLAGSIVQCNDEMEEIGFPKITWWLFFKMCSAHSGPETHTHTYNKLTFRKLARNRIWR